MRKSEAPRRHQDHNEAKEEEARRSEKKREEEEARRSEKKKRKREGPRPAVAGDNLSDDDND
ncbi:MAG: hypothetical protein ACK55I_35065, partial [bacterium]